MLSTCALLFCVHPVGGAPTLEVAAASQHASLPQTLEIAPSVWRRFHRRDASSGTLNTSLSGGAFSRRTGGVFLSWKRKKARVPFTMRQAVVFEISLNYLLMKLNNGYRSSLLVIACDYQPLYSEIHKHLCMGKQTFTHLRQKTFLSYSAAHQWLHLPF